MMQQYNCVLLVDNDPVTNYINQKVIKRAGLCNNIKVALNGEEALNFLIDNAHQQSLFPSLIFLDLNMPVMDGMQFLEQFKKHTFPKQPKILVLTTSNNAEDIDRVKSYGVHPVLSKPLNEKHLKEIQMERSC